VGLGGRRSGGVLWGMGWGTTRADSWSPPDAISPDEHLDRSGYYIRRIRRLTDVFVAVLGIDTVER
jgi:hypothetical protein